MCLLHLWGLLGRFTQSAYPAEVYATIGHNVCWEARPSVVHFGGFTVGRVHEQHVRLCNTSSSSTGMHVVLPTTPYFKVNTGGSRSYAAARSRTLLIVPFTLYESLMSLTFAGILREQERFGGTWNGGCYHIGVLSY